MRKSLAWCLAMLLSANPSYGRAFEREQEPPAMISLESKVMMHYMQGRGFFKQSNYELARQEFERALELDRQYKPAYIYLERIEDLKQQKIQEHAQKYDNIESLLNKEPRKAYATSNPQGLIDKYTEDQQAKLDAYQAEETFNRMLDRQRLTVASKAGDIKQGMTELFKETRTEDLLNRAKNEMVTPLAAGFEETESKPVPKKERAAQVQSEQDDVDMGFYFSRQKKVKDFYQRGVMFYKQKDYFKAKKYFEQVLKLEPGYRYTQEYYDSIRSQLVLAEIRERRMGRRNLRGFEAERPNFADESLEFVSEKVALEESQKLARKMGEKFTKQEETMRRMARRKLLKAGEEALKQKDYPKAMELFTEILAFDPQNRKAQKLQKETMELLASQEEAFLEALSVARDLAQRELIQTQTPQQILQAKAERIRRISNLDPDVREKEVASLYRKAKDLYRDERYEQALDAFEELDRIQPSYKYVSRYITKTKEFLENERKAKELRAAQATEQEEAQKLQMAKEQSQKLSKDQEKSMFKKARRLYKQKEYQQAASLLWQILKSNPDHRKAQRLLKNSASRLDMSLEDLTAEQKAMDAKMKAEQDAKALAENSSDPIMLYEKAKTFFRAGKFSEALPLFDRVVELDPNHRYAPRYAKRCREKIAEAQMAKSQDAGQSAPAPAVASQQIDVSATKQVLEVYEQAKSLYREGQYAQAAEKFEHVVAHLPDHKYAPRYLAKCVEKLAEQGVNYEPNVPAEPQVVAPAATEPVVAPEVKAALPAGTFQEHYDQGKVHYRAGEYDKAIVRFEQAVALQPNHKYAPRYLQKSKEKFVEQGGDPQAIAPESAPTAAASPAVSIAPAKPAAPAPVKTAPAASAPATAPAADAQQTALQTYDQAKKLYRAGKYQEAGHLFERVVAAIPDHKYAPRYLEKCKEKVAEQGQTYQPLPKEALMPAAKPEPMKKLAPVATANAQGAPKAEANSEQAALQIYDQAKKLYRSGKYQEAGNLFEQVITAIPGHKYAPRYLEKCKEKLAEQGKTYTDYVAPKAAPMASKEAPVKAAAKPKMVKRSLPKDPNKLYEQAKAYFREERYHKAYVTFNEVLKLQKGNKFAQRYLRKTEEKLAEMGLTVPEEQGRVIDPEQVSPGEVSKQQVEQWFEFGKRFYRSKEYSKAKLYFELVKKSSPLHPYVQKYLNRLPKHIETPEQALSSEKTAWQSSLEAQFALGKEHFDAGRFAEAYSVFSQLKREAPNFKKADSYLKRLGNMDVVGHIYRQGKEALDQKNYVLATDKLQQVLEIDPEHRLAKRYLRHLNKRVTPKQVERLRQSQQQARKRPSQEQVQNVEKLLSEGKEDFKAGRFEQAMLKFNTIQAKGYDDPELSRYLKRLQNMDIVDHVYQQGKEHLQAKRYEQAYERFEVVQKLDPKHKYAGRHLMSLHKRGIKPKTMEVTDSSERSTKQMFSMAKKAFSRKDYAYAEEMFQKLLESEPGHKQAKRFLKKTHKILTKQNRRMRKSKAAKPQKAPSQKMSAKMVDQQEAPSSRIIAKERRKQSRMVQKRNEELELFKQGKNLYRLGHYEKAIEVFEDILKLNPQNSYAQMFINYCQQKQTEQQMLELEKQKLQKLGQLSLEQLQEQERQINELRSQKTELQKAGEKQRMRREKELKSHLKQAKGKHRQKDYAQAKEYYEEALRVDPFDDDALSGLQENVQLIREQSLEDIAKQKEIDSVIEKGRTLFEDQQYEDALNHFKKAWYLQPRSSTQLKTIQNYLEKCYQRLEKEKIMESDEFSELKVLREREEKMLKKMTWVSKGKEHFEARQYDLALVQFEKALVLDPEDALVKRYIMNVKVAQEEELERLESKMKSEQERKEMAKLVDNERRVTKYIAEGRELYGQGQYESALSRFQEILKIDPNDAIAKDYVYLSKEHIEKRKAKEEQYLWQLQRDRVRVERELREKELARSKEKERFEHMNQKIQLFNERFDRAKNLYDSGQYELAFSEFELILKEKPEDSFVLEYMNLARQKLDIQEDAQRRRIQKEKEKVFEEELSSYQTAGQAFKEAKRFYRAGDYEKALRIFKLVWSLDAQFEKMDDVQFYIEKIDKKLKESSKPKQSMVDRLYDQGKELFIDEQWAEAERIFVQVQAVNPNYKSVALYLQTIKEELQKDKLQIFFDQGEQAFNDKQMHESLKQFRKILDVMPHHQGAREYAVAILIILGKEQYDRDNFQTAKEHFTDVLEIEPNNRVGQKYLRLIGNERKKEEYYKEAKDYYDQGELHEAFEAFQKVLEIDPEYKLTQKLLASIEEKLEVIEQLERKKKVDQLIAQGRSAYDKFEYEKSVGFFDDAIKLDPHNETALRYKDESKKVMLKENLYNKAKAVFEQEQYEEAAKLFSKVAELDPGHKYALRYMQRARRMIDEKQKKQTARQIQTLLVEGKQEYEQYNYSKAQELYEQVEQLDPKNTEAKQYLDVIRKKKLESEIYETAKTLYREGKYQSAMAEFSRVIRLNPTHKFAYRYLQQCEEQLAKMGVIIKAEPAVGADGKVIPPSDQPFDVEATFERGKKLYRDRLYSDAMQEFYKVLAYDPAHKGSQKYLERCQNHVQDVHTIFDNAKVMYMAKDYAGALKEFYRVLALDPQYKNVQKYVDRCRKHVAKDSVEETRMKQVSDLIAEGKEHYKNKDYAKAMESFGKVIASDPKNREARKWRKKVKPHFQRMAKEMKIEKKQEENQKIAEWLKTAEKHLDKDELDEAENIYKQILVLDSLQVEALRGVGKVKKRRKKIENEAKQKLKDQQALKEEQIDNALSQAAALIDEKDYAKASKLLKRVLDQRPDHPRAKKYIERISKAMLREHKEQEKLRKEEEKDFSASSAKDIEKLVKMEKKYQQKAKSLGLGPELSHKRAQMEKQKVLEQARLDQAQAEQRAKQAKQQLQQQGRSMDEMQAFNLAKNFYEKGRYYEALELFKRVWQLNPNFEKIGEVQEYLEKISKQIYEQKKDKVYFIEKSYVKAKDFYMAGNWKEAIRLLTEISEINPDYKATKMYLRLATEELERQKV